VCVCVCGRARVTGRHLSVPANNGHLFRFYTLIVFYKFSFLIPFVVLLIFYEYFCQRMRSHAFLQSKDFIHGSWRDKFWWGNKPKFVAWPFVLWCCVWLYLHEIQFFFLNYDGSQYYVANCSWSEIQTCLILLDITFRTFSKPVPSCGHSYYTDKYQSNLPCKWFCWTSNPEQFEL